MDYGVSELSGVRINAKRVRPKEWVDFKCQRCGACCRHLTEKVMVENLDAFRLVQYLREHGQPCLDMADFYAQYTTPVPISRGYPIFTLNTVGEDEACVFLKDGACSVYPARTRTCRLYPFSVGPGKRGREFEWVLSQDAGHHFHGGKVQVKDWFYQNFSKADREFATREYDACRKIGALLAEMDFSTYEQALPAIILLRYHEFDVNAPFFPQYDHNLQALLRHLRRLLGKEK